MKNSIIKIGKNFFELLTNISPVLSAKCLFFMRTKKWVNLKRPKTFNDKMTYLKLFIYPKNELVIQCTDKYEVRKFIENKGYKNILNELYGVYDNFNQIDFTQLPDKFAIKCTHGCAYNIICKDKNLLDLKNAESKINTWMKEKYGRATTELHYIKCKPKIIIEKYLCDENNKMPVDYKFYCFSGVCKCILVCSERESELKLNYFDLNWNELNYGKESWKNKKKIEKPKKLKEMIEISENLSKKFPFVRVDLYNDDEKIVFGEMTFTPACCCAPYYSKEGNLELGKYLTI